MGEGSVKATRGEEREGSVSSCLRVSRSVVLPDKGLQGGDGVYSTLRLQTDRIAVSVLGWVRSELGCLRLEVWGASVMCWGTYEGGGRCERKVARALSELSGWAEGQGFLLVRYGVASIGAWRPA